MASYLENNERDWSSLPIDIVCFVSTKLPDISDFIIFRAVCKPWRSSAPASELPPQLPWLVEKKKGDKNLRFYSIFSRKIYTIQCAASRDKCLKGAAYGGYMLVYRPEEEGIFLLNPITNNKVHLPFVNITCPSPCWISSDPIRGVEYVVVSGTLDNSNLQILAFCRPGDDKWVRIECGRGHLSNSALINGKLLSIEKYTRVTRIIDMATETLTRVLPPRREKQLSYSYFVESFGEILQVAKVYDGTKYYKFSIYKLDFENDKDGLVWIEISSIGDRIIFLDRSQGISFAASNFVDFKGNCIYYVQNIIFPARILRYDLEDETTEELYCSLCSKDWATWFVPTLV